MKTRHTIVSILGILAAGLCLVPANVHAQYGAVRPSPELSATYGSMWGGHLEADVGTFRLGTGGSWGVALDVPVMSGTTVELSYNHQDGSLDYDQYGVTTLTDMSVDYWQIGTVRSIARGRVIPFVLGGLGATYYKPDKKSVSLDGDAYTLESATKFSLNFGLGLKTYFGETQRVGLRASIKALPTFFNTGGGIWFGSGGATVAFTGSSIWQYEVAGGLTVRLGR